MKKIILLSSAVTATAIAVIGLLCFGCYKLGSNLNTTNEEEKPTNTITLDKQECIVCLTCDKEVLDGKEYEDVYCSKECHDRYEAKKPKEEGGMTFESEAPYGRCQGCNCALTSKGKFCSQCNEKTGLVCAQCQGTLRVYHSYGPFEDEFCSQSCSDKWYTIQREMNETKYNCIWCGNAMNQYQYDTWNGCCSEICAVNREGTAYENEERDMIGIAPAKDENMYHGEIPDGGVTICGWCGARVMDDGAFCSNVCEQAHHNYYRVN